MKKPEIVYEDDSLFVLNKPAGLAVQGGAGIGVSVDSLLAGLYHPAPYLLHRLDKDTSGALLVAKTRTAATACSKLFAVPRDDGLPGDSQADTGRLKKRYAALCAGIPEKTGLITIPLSIKGKNLPAKTGCRLVSVSVPQDCASGNTNGPGRFSLLELVPATGRMHQLRRHAALAGCPILGDDKYGDFSLNKRLKKSLGLHFLLLHALSLYLPHPLVKGGILVNVPPPDYFLEFMEKTGFPAFSP